MKSDTVEFKVGDRVVCNRIFNNKFDGEGVITEVNDRNLTVDRDDGHTGSGYNNGWIIVGNERYNLKIVTKGEAVDMSGLPCSGCGATGCVVSTPHYSFCEACRDKADAFIPERNTGDSILSTKRGIIKSKRTFGVELECFNNKGNRAFKYGLASIPTEYGIKNDCSISVGISKEVATPILGGKAGEDSLMATCSTLTKFGFSTNDSCGTHCHIAIPEAKRGVAKTEKLLKNLAIFYSVFDPAIVSLLKEDRRNTNYAKYFMGKVIKIDVGNKKLLDDSFSKTRFDTLFYQVKRKSDTIRYKRERCVRDRWGINFYSVYFRGTLEIRYHEGSLDGEELVNWIAFHAGIIDSIMDGTIKEGDILDCLSIKNTRELLIKLLDLIKDNINPSVEEVILKRYDKYLTLNKKMSKEYISLVGENTNDYEDEDEAWGLDEDYN